MSDKFNIIVGGGTFTLTRDQVEFDSPNYFTACFLGESAGAQTRTSLSRNPELFRIIVEYLSGYEVLPLHDSAIPKRMSADNALRNLLVDAQFYLLNGLADRIKASSNKSTGYVITVASSYWVFTKFDLGNWDGPFPISEDRASQIRQKHDIDLHSSGGWASARVSIDHLLRNIAKIREPYMVDSSWVTVGPVGSPGQHYVVLKLLV